MKRVSAARGIRLVSRKLRSSCWVNAEIRPLTVMNLLGAEASASVMETSLPILSLSAAALAGAAAAFPKIQARIALSRAKHRSLTGHSKMSKMVARMVPHYEFDIDEFFCSDGAPKDIAMQRQDGFFRLAGLYADRYPKGRALTAEVTERISDLQFTENLPRAVPVQPPGARASRHLGLRAGLARRHRHRPRRQCVLRPDRLLRRQHLRQRLLQGVHRRG